MHARIRLLDCDQHASNAGLAHGVGARGASCPEGSRVPASPSSLSDLGLRCTHHADNSVWCSTKFHDAAATNTISPIVTKRQSKSDRLLGAVSLPGPAPASSRANLLACGRWVGSGPGRRWHPHAQ
jgi:hypothetical protein